MGWKCYGTSGTFCHTGLQYFRSDVDGMCVKDPDQDYNPTYYPFNFYYIVVLPKGAGGYGRELVGYYNGSEYYRASFGNSWTWGYIRTVLDRKSECGLYRFELQDRNGKSICSKEIFTGVITEEPIPLPEPEPSDIDYDKIVEGTALIVNTAQISIEGEVNDNQVDIERVRQQVIDSVAEANANIVSTRDSINDGLESLGSSITDHVTGVIGGVTEKLSEVVGSIDGLEIPTLTGIKNAFLDVCADLATALWDAILDKIEERYPNDEEER